MHLSVWPAAQHRWSDTLAFAEHCDATGWHGLWFEDHLMSPAGALAETPQPTLELWTTLAAIGAATDRLRLGSLVSSVTYRHPGVIASAALTVDQISEGRVTLGVGAGWQADEHAAYGLPLGDRRTRSDRFEEGCRAIRSLLDHERTTFRGEHFNFDDAARVPKGYEGRRVPLLIAGKGEQRTLRTVAENADAWNAWATPDELLSKRRVLDQHCVAIDRDPTTIATTTQAFICPVTDASGIERFLEQWGHRPVLHGSDLQIAEQIDAYRQAGADELIVCDWGLTGRHERIETCARLADLVGLSATPQSNPPIAER